MRLIKILFILFLLGSNCFAATWYLSPTGSNTEGDGSSGDPWFSPAKAKKSTGAISAGDTVIFKNGTYTYDEDSFYLGYTGNDSGTSENKIIYRAEDTTHSVKLDFEGDRGIRLANDTGADYITVDGLVVLDFKADGILMDDSNQTIRNCYVSATNTWPPTGSARSVANAGGGIVCTEEATNFLVENCIVDQCAYNNTSHGMYLAGGSGTVRDCIARNNIGNGIQIQSGTTGHVIGDIDVYRNKVYDNTDAFGIYASSYSGGTIGTLNIYNNLVWGNGDNYASGFGITVSNYSTFTAANIWNNTLWDNHYGLNNSTVVGTMRNNIAVSNGTADISSATITNGSLTRSDNLTTDGDEGNGVEGTFATTDFQSTTASSDDFLKIDASNNAIDAGYDLSGTFTDDYFANERTGTWDIGAHEYGASSSTPTPTITVGAGTTVTVGAGTVITVGAN